MASRFSGRDYSTLRSEIIEFLRTRFPNEWDYTNLSDPAVIFAESLARIGDQLHFTIDEIRRECDIATAQRASSIYSYALREGYRLMLPRGASGIANINAKQSDSFAHLKINKFDEVKVKNSDSKLYARNSIDADLQTQPTEDDYKRLSDEDLETRSRALMARTQRLSLVLGERLEFKFSYYDINRDFTVDLPEAFIDRDLISLRRKRNNADEVEMQYVTDVISAGFVGNIYSLTPKFVGGSTSLSIEFPSNYKDVFNETDTFTFTYIKILDDTLLDDVEIDLSDYLSPIAGYETLPDGKDRKIQMSDLSINLGNGIKGYTGYEDPRFTRENYKRFLQDYSALLTKDDYVNYVKSLSMGKCKVFDISDTYNGTITDGKIIPPRVVYVMTDLKYPQREDLFYRLQSRSSRSDCIAIVPFGKDPYMIVVKADCFLLGVSAASVATSIKSAIISYFSDETEERIPTTSMINYIAHSTSQNIASVNSCVLSDTLFGKPTSDFSDVLNLTSKDTLRLFECLSSLDINSGKDIILPSEKDNLRKYIVDDTMVPNPCLKYYIKTFNRMPDQFPVLSNGYDKDSPDYHEYNTYDEIIETQRIYGQYDRIDLDVANDKIFRLTDKFITVGEEHVSIPEIAQNYKMSHYMQPCLSRVVVLINPVTY